MRAGKFFLVALLGIFIHQAKAEGYIADVFPKVDIINHGNAHDGLVIFSDGLTSMKFKVEVAGIVNYIKWEIRYKDGRMNVINNAGYIVVDRADRPEYVKVSVNDDGTDMPYSYKWETYDLELDSIPLYRYPHSLLHSLNGSARSEFTAINRAIDLDFFRLNRYFIQQVSQVNCYKLKFSPKKYFG